MNKEATIAGLRRTILQATGEAIRFTASRSPTSAQNAWMRADNARAALVAFASRGEEVDPDLLTPEPAPGEPAYIAEANRSLLVLPSYVAAAMKIRVLEATLSRARGWIEEAAYPARPPILAELQPVALAGNEGAQSAIPAWLNDGIAQISAAIQAPGVLEEMMRRAGLLPRPGPVYPGCQVSFRHDDGGPWTVMAETESPNVMWRIERGEERTNVDHAALLMRWTIAPPAGGAS